MQMHAQQFMMRAVVRGSEHLDPRLQGLLGCWLGRDGTRYELSEDTPSSLTVTTTRPNGQRRTTRGLVSAALDAYVRWGRNGQYYLEESGLPESAVWCEARCLGAESMPTKHVVFNWSREDANSSRDHVRDSSCPPARGFGRPSRSRSRISREARSPDHRCRRRSE